MAILDTEYVKAPSLRAGDLSITKSSTGFSIVEGDTVFLTGATDGTLTIGKEDLASSIPALHINAAEVYWNNKPLEDYWEEESGPVVPDLTQDVTELQELTAANAQAIQNTDKRLSQELSDLRLDALGAKVNTLVSSINNYVSNICGIAVPVTLLKEALPYFNKITLNNVQNEGTGYLAIYACDTETPSVSSPCTLLYVSEASFETTGAPTVPTSSILEIPEKINVPDSGLIILIFASSATAPQADNISWITAENSTMFIRMGIYSPGGTNRPYDTNGEYVLQKVTNAAFITYSPDIDFSYVVYGESDDILSADVEVIRSQISDLRSDLEGYATSVETLSVNVETLSDDVEEVTSQINDIRSDLEDYMTSEKTIEVVTSQIADLRSNLDVELEGYMTSSETFDAIDNFPGYTSGYEYPLGSLVYQLANTNASFQMLKRPIGQVNNEQFNSVLIDYSGISFLLGGSTEGSNPFHNSGHLKLADQQGFHALYRYAGYGNSSKMAQLVLDSGHLELSLQRDDNSGGFEFIADTITNASSNTGMHMVYYSPFGTSHVSHLSMNGRTVELLADDDKGYAGIEVNATGIKLLQFSGIEGRFWELKFDHGGLGLGVSGSGLDWDAMTNEYSSFIPTISVVYAMIRSALANQ